MHQFLRRMPVFLCLDILSELFRQKCWVSQRDCPHFFRQNGQVHNLTAVCSCDFSAVLSELFRQKCHLRHQTAAMWLHSVLVISLPSCRNSSDKSAIFAIRLQSVLMTSLKSCRNPSNKMAIFTTWLQSLFLWLLCRPVGTLPTKVPHSQPDCSLFSLASLTSCRNPSDESAILAFRLQSVLVTSLTSGRNSSDKSAILTTWLQSV